MNGIKIGASAGLTIGGFYLMFLQLGTFWSVIGIILISLGLGLLATD